MGYICLILQLTILVTTNGIPDIIKAHGPTWGPSGADSNQVGPMLAPWTLPSCIAHFGVIGVKIILNFVLGRFMKIFCIFGTEKFWQRGHWQQVWWHYDTLFFFITSPLWGQPNDHRRIPPIDWGNVMLMRCWWGGYEFTIWHMVNKCSQ